MKKERLFLKLVFILLLSALAFNIVFPQYLNRGLALLKIGWQFPSLPFKLGLDLQGGSHLVYEADVANLKEEDIAESLQGLRAVIERRVNLFGVSEPVVALQENAKPPRLVVELPGITNVNQAIEMIGKVPYLEFKEQKDEAQTEMLLSKQKELQDLLEGEYKDAPQAAKEAKIKEYESFLIDPYFKETELTGRYLKSAQVVFDNTSYEPSVSLEFSDEGAKIFETLTQNNIGKPLAIYVDSVLLSSPTVQEAISGGKAQITGQFTLEQAKELARNLNAGALPVKITLIQQTTIGPTLGKVYLDKSLQAGLWGFLLVALFMLLFYRLNGLVAILALCFYGLLMLSLFKLIPVVLTLAGIAGAILSIGMAVDANVLVFERLREERKKEQTITSVVNAAFSRAWPSIRDSSFTTLIVGALMFAFGDSFIKGFAFTLGLGVLISMFSALFVSKTIMRLLIKIKLSRIKWLF